MTTHTQPVSTEQRISSTTINIGVLLEVGKDRDKFRKILSHDPSLNYVIEPKSIEKFFEYLIKLAKRGKRIKWLVLMGHGSKKHPHIGALRPHDIDIDITRKLVESRQARYEKAQATVASLKGQLSEADEEAKKSLLKKLRDAQADLKTYGELLKDRRTQLETLESLADVMAPDARVLLLNCYPAGSEDGIKMMRNLGKILLVRRGGRVVGCENAILTIQNKPLIAWLARADDTGLLPLGPMSEIIVRPHRCGMPCLSFVRYGYCDNRRSKDGGPCWLHRPGKRSKRAVFYPMSGHHWLHP